MSAPRSSTLTVRTAIVLGVATLAASVGFALRWPNAWWGSGPGDRTDFDYSALDARFGSLRDGYVRSLLGGDGADGRSRKTASSAFGAAETSPAVMAVSHRFTNDNFEGAYEIESVPFRGRTDTSRATRQSSEPAGCTPVGGTAWYRYRAPRAIALFADTFGTPKATSLGVYTGTSRGALHLVGCDTNGLGNAQVGFRAVGGRTYYFQLTASVRGGSTTFGLSPVGRTRLETRPLFATRRDGVVWSHPEISGDGRYVAFISKARNLTATPPKCETGGRSCDYVYVRDRKHGTNTVIATTGVPYEQDQPFPVITYLSMSTNGRYVGFSTYADPVFGGRTPAGGYTDGPSDAEFPAWNAYLYDRLTHRVELVSRNSRGEAGRASVAASGTTVDGPLMSGALGTSTSADGRYVTFFSDAANFGGPVEPGKAWNVYHRDRVTGITRLVSTDQSGRPLRGNSRVCTGRNMSGDGRYVAFKFNGDDGVPAIYLWDARTGRGRLVSKVPEGKVRLGSYCPAMSLDGSRLGFVSRDQLVTADTNSTPDVYVYDVRTSHLRRISVTSEGSQTTDPHAVAEDCGCYDRAVTLSADGNVAVFDSAAPDVAPSAVGSTRHKPGVLQVFVHDLRTRATRLASVSSTGEPLKGISGTPYLAADGSALAFMHGDTPETWDIAVHELL